MTAPNSNTFDPNTAIPPLTDKIYIITGGSAGIGYGITAHILQHNPAKIYLLGRSSEHLDEAHSALSAYGDTSKISLIQCDLGSLSQTHAAAMQLYQKLKTDHNGRLDALILNAGLGVGPYAESEEDKLDTHMQVNVISQHHLAMTLLPLLAGTPGSRLCLQSSDMHKIGTSGVRFLSLEEINHDIGASSLYGRTKLAQICLMRAMYRRKRDGLLLPKEERDGDDGGGDSGGAAAPGEGGLQWPVIIATHPGAVVTDQQEQAVDAYGLLGKIGVAVARPFMKDPIDEGCRSMLFAATADDVVSLAEDIYDGAYIVPDCKVGETSKQAQDEELQERCWSLVQGILKDRLGH